MTPTPADLAELTALLAETRRIRDRLAISNPTGARYSIACKDVARLGALVAEPEAGAA